MILSHLFDGVIDVIVYIPHVLDVCLLRSPVCGSQGNTGCARAIYHRSPCTRPLDTPDIVHCADISPPNILTCQFILRIL